MEERAVQQQQEISALRNELGALRNSTEQLRRNYEDERRARQELQQWRANKAQLIALVEKQAQKYASMDIDIDEVLRDSGTWRTLALNGPREWAGEHIHSPFLENAALTGTISASHTARIPCTQKTTGGRRL